jgi:hypothetical protein
MERERYKPQNSKPDVGNPTMDNPKGFNSTTLAVIDFLNGDRRTGACLCPCHDDGQNPSLQVSDGDKVKTVIHCFGRDSKEHDLEVVNHLRQNGVLPTSNSLSHEKLSERVELDRSPEHRRRYAQNLWRALRINNAREHLMPLLQYYLHGRGIKEVPATARITMPQVFLKCDGSEETASHDPGMVLPVRNKEGHLQGIHVIWLSPDLSAKREAEPQRQSYGLIKGNFVELTEVDPEQRLQKLIIAEGPETALAMMQLTGIPAIATAGKGFMKALDPPAADEYIIAPDCDDDGESRKEAGLLAQRLVGCVVRIAMPIRPEGGKKGYDWNDALIDAGADELKLRELGRAIIEAPLFDAIITAEEKREVQINAIAQLKLDDHLAYEQVRIQASTDLKMRVGVLDEEVDRRCQLLREKTTEPPKPDTELLAASARDIIACKDVLGMLSEDIGKFIAGEVPIIKMIYIAGTSRLFDKGMHAAVKGVSSGGKSEVRKRVVAYFPPEAVIEFTAMSERALLYFREDFKHKILSMGEARGPEEVKFQDLCLRELMSENKLRYHVPVKIGNKIETVAIEKNGPVVFIVTTTRHALNPENETRMLSLEIDDSETQTRQVLVKVAEVEGYGRVPVEADLKKWHDFQRWLEAGECRVHVWFAKTLGRLLGSTRSVRLRRDFGQLLRAVKAHALLHREHRERNDDGWIKATIEEDYAAVRKLMADLLATASEVKMSKVLKQTVAAVDEVEQRYQQDERTARAREAAGLKGVTVNEVADALKLDRSTAYRRLRVGEDAGRLVNVEERKARAARYQSTGQQLSVTVRLLPTADEIIEEVGKRKGVGTHRANPKNDAQLHRKKSTR